MKSLYFILINTIILFGCSNKQIAKKNRSDKFESIKIVSYKFNENHENSFETKRFLKISENLKVEVLDKNFNGNSKYSFQLEKSIYEKIINALNHNDGIQNNLNKDLSTKNINYAGNYHYITINRKNHKDSMCFIWPSTKIGFRNILEELSNEVRKNHLEKFEKNYNKINNDLAKEIIPLHKKSSLPKIKLPPREID